MRIERFASSLTSSRVDAPDGQPALSGLCLCRARISAERAGRFLYRFAEPVGWCFADDPPRTTTFEKAYRAEQNHNGEPFIWDLCPFCGREMIPPPNPYQRTWNGEEGG